MKPLLMFGVIISALLSGCTLPGDSRDSQKSLDAFLEHCQRPAVGHYWWSERLFSPHFGCANIYNAFVQKVPIEPPELAAPDSTMAISTISRYRKGEVMPLREQSLDVGGNGN